MCQRKISLVRGGKCSSVFCYHVSSCDCFLLLLHHVTLVLKMLCRRFRHTISHRLDLESVYKHTLPGSGSPEVTTLHSDVGATVDYIFYSPKRTLTRGQKGTWTCHEAGEH